MYVAISALALVSPSVAILEPECADPPRAELLRAHTECGGVQIEAPEDSLSRTLKHRKATKIGMSRMDHEPGFRGGERSQSPGYKKLCQ